MIINHPEHSHWLEINDISGLPVAVHHSAGIKRLDLLEFKISLTVGGLEVRSPTGGLDYEGTSEITGSQLEGRATWKSNREGDRCCLPIRIGEIAASFEVLFRRHGAGVSISVVLLGDENSSLLIRDLKISTQFQLPNSGWMLNAPGNGLARDVRLGEITSWAGISCIGGLRGSSAVLHLGNQHSAMAVWFKHELEVTDIRIKSESGNTLDLELSSNFAGDLSRISSASIDLFELDLHVPQFADFPELFQTWLRFSGHTTPDNPPTWIGGASIFEAQIGYSVFYPNHRYEPYPTVSDLTNDLERIAKLGFKVDRKSVV